MKKVKNFCLIGNPVSHSFSPLIHNFFIYSKGLNAGYVCLPIEEEQMDDFVKLLKENFNGFNITVPYKELIINYLDDIDNIANDIGAVNCVKIINDRMIGFNTDYFGIEKTFELTGINLNSKKIVVIGAGGASKPLFYLLKKIDYDELIIVNRTIEKAEQLRKNFNLTKCKIFSLDYLEKTETCDIIINSSAIGLKGDFSIEMNINVREAAFDMQYSLDDNTPFLSKINVSKKIDGKIMLIYQAYKSFCIWNDTDINFDYREIIKKMRS